MYPVTIIKTRYGGAYEKGEWAAFNLHHDEIPPSATGDDTSCHVFWLDAAPNMAVGVGATPAQALKALKKQVTALREKYSKK